MIVVQIDPGTGRARFKAPDRPAIRLVKKAPPALRSYIPASKEWTVSHIAWPAVHQDLVDAGYIVSLHG